MMTEMVIRKTSYDALSIDARQRISTYKLNVPGVDLVVGRHFTCVMYYSHAYTVDEIVSSIKQANNLVEEGTTSPDEFRLMKK